MRIFALFVLAGSLLCSAALLAQEQIEESRPTLKYRAAADTIDQTEEHVWSRDSRHDQIFACARKHPLSPHDVEMREAVRKLGANRHHFVRVKLRNGSAVVGGITFVGEESFSVSQGIWGSKLIPYRAVESTPKLAPAIGEHLENGMKWTGVVAGYIIAVPVALMMMPLMLTGILAD